MLILSKIARAGQLSIGDWQILTRAILELLSARIRFAIIPTPNIISHLQRHSKLNQFRELTEDNILHLKRISWAIAAASARLPWRSDCLIQAMAADRWLRRYGIVGEFYLGVATKQSGALSAHVWLRCGNVTVTGGAAEVYTPLIEPR